MRSRGGIAAAVLMAGVSIPAVAQDVPPPDYEPRGLPAGAFRAYPTIYAGIFYDDNVYRTDAGTIGDTVYNFGAALDIRSGWSRHMLNLSGSLDDFRYDKNTLENRTEWRVGADGRLDIVRGAALSGNASYATLFEPRYSPNDTGFAASPTEYTVSRYGGSLSYHPFRLGVEIGGTYDRYDFKNTPLIGGGVQNNRDRDHEEIGAYGQVTYEFSPGYGIFLRGSFEERNFALDTDRSGLQRDSEGYAVDTGLELALTRLVQGRIYVGYIDQDYVAPLPDVTGLNYGAAITWSPTRLLTVRLDAARRLVDTILPGVSASDDRVLGIAFDYELLRNLLVTADFEYIFTDFPGSPREDETMSAGFGFRYFMNNYVSAAARYGYSTRTSSDTGLDFDNNIFRFSVNLHF